jgi:hypothetical protein
MLVIAIGLVAIIPSQAQSAVDAVSVTGNANTCEAVGPAGLISARFNVAGTVRLRSYAYTEYYRELFVVGNTSGGGQVIDIVVNKPQVPAGTWMHYNLTVDNDFTTALGISINCTSGEVKYGASLGRDGRINIGNDVPLAIFPILDANGNPALEFWTATEKGNGRRFLTISNKQLTDANATAAAKPGENILIFQTKDKFVTLYRLTTGEYQVNLAPDKEGKVPVIRFDAIQPTTVTRADY